MRLIAFLVFCFFITLTANATVWHSDSSDCDVIVNFQDKANGAILSGTIYGGITWGSGTPNWRIWDGTALGYTKNVYIDSQLTTQVSKTFTLPAGNVLKSIKMAIDITPGATKQVILQSTGNPDLTYTDLTTVWQTKVTGWNNAAEIVTVKVTSDSTHGASDVIFDDVTYTCVPGASPSPTPTPTATPSPSPGFPLKISSNNRYLTLQDGTPFLIVGDSPWEAMTCATRPQIDTYLNNRQAKGFNAIIIQVIDKKWGPNAPNDLDGVAPFTTPGNFSTYNAPYYDRLDYIIDGAANRGMVVLLFPAYLGFGCGTAGFASEMQNDSQTDLEAYGTFLGNRYKNKGNIIWVMGGDADASACGVLTKQKAMAQAIQTADPNHLFTSHNNATNGGSEAVTMYINNGGVPPWLTLNSTYGPSPQSFTLGNSAWNRPTTRPFFHLEAWYENQHSITRQTLRSEAYWSMLTNICGYFFGNCPIYGFSSPVTLSQCSGADPDWVANMDHEQSVDMTRFKNLFTSVAWQTLVPDFLHTFATAGYGNLLTTVTTALASDGSFAISYLPAVAGLTVDLAQISGPSTKAQWYDPSSGTYTTISGSPFPNSGPHTFTPTGANSTGATDWVLLLESSTGCDDVIVNFQDKANGAILSGTIYGGITWGSGTPNWRIWDGTALGYTKNVYIDSQSISQVSKTFTLPSGNVLKSLKIASDTSPATVTVILQSTGNPDLTYTDINTTYETKATGWTNIATTVTVKVTSNSAHGASDIIFDDITYGCPN
jgi:hypothetical protein